MGDRRYCAPSSTAAILSSTAFTLSSTSATLLSTLSAISATPLTLPALSTACVAFSTCAEAIPASSRVSLSNLFIPSSTSAQLAVFLNSFFRNFSKNRSVTDHTSVQQTLTHSALPNSVCCNPKNIQDFSHYFRDYIHHSLIQCRFSVNLQSSEKRFKTLEDLKKCVFTCTHILSCLRGDRITLGCTNI